MVKPVSESELIRRCRDGDIDAYTTLISTYENKILSYCYRMLGNRADAEDAAQEVFVKVFRFIDKFSEQSAFSTWLYKIASNVCMDMLRKTKGGKAEHVSLHTQNEDGEEFALPLADSAPSPYERAQLSEAQRVLSEALAKLPPEQKQVIILRDVEGLSYEEIAETIGTAPGTVKSRINRARKALQKILEPNRELFLL